MSVKITVDKLGEIMKSINTLVSKDVLVGIPDSKANRTNEDGEPINNAQLGYIHEYGSPINNLPARPFLGTGVEAAKDEIADRLESAAKNALDGKYAQMNQGFDKAGLVAQNSVKNVFNSGQFAPLADSTLRARASRGGTRGKAAQRELASRSEGNAPSNAEIKPLVDSGQLRNSITYVVRKK